MSDFYLKIAICLPENLLRACEPVCLRLCLSVLVYVPCFFLYKRDKLSEDTPHNIYTRQNQAKNCKTVLTYHTFCATLQLPLREIHGTNNNNNNNKEQCS